MQLTVTYVCRSVNLLKRSLTSGSCALLIGTLFVKTGIQFGAHLWYKSKLLIWLPWQVSMMMYALFTVPDVIHLWNNAWWGCVYLRHDILQKWLWEKSSGGAWNANGVHLDSRVTVSTECINVVLWSVLLSHKNWSTIHVSDQGTFWYSWSFVQCYILQVIRKALPELPPSPCPDNISLANSCTLTEMQITLRLALVTPSECCVNLCNFAEVNQDEVI